MNEEDMRVRGEKLAVALNLRKARNPRNGKPYDPPRYMLGPGHLSKTAVGVYLTVQALAEETRKEGAKP